MVNQGGFLAGPGVQVAEGGGLGRGPASAQEALVIGPVGGTVAAGEAHRHQARGAEIVLVQEFLARAEVHGVVAGIGQAFGGAVLGGLVGQAAGSGRSRRCCPPAGLR